MAPSSPLPPLLLPSLKKKEGAFICRTGLGAKHPDSLGHATRCQPKGACFIGCTAATAQTGLQALENRTQSKVSRSLGLVITHTRGKLQPYHTLMHTIGSTDPHMKLHTLHSRLLLLLALLLVFDLGGNWVVLKETWPLCCKPQLHSACTGGCSATAQQLLFPQNCNENEQSMNKEKKK